MDEHLQWREHIDHLAKKISGASAVLWKLRKLLPTKSKKLIYDTLVQSHLTFMIINWGTASCNAIKALQIAQNRALKNTYDLPRELSRVPMYLNYVESHLPIRGLCVLNIARYVYAVRKNVTHSNLVFRHAQPHHNKTLRSSKHPRLEKFQARSMYGTKSIESLGPQIYTELPLQLQLLPHQHAFKWAIKCHLRNEKFIHSCFDASFFDLKISPTLL
jgi:hypothetical protein